MEQDLATQVFKLFMLCLSTISGILLKESGSCEGRSGGTSLISHWEGWEDAAGHCAMPCQGGGFRLSVVRAAQKGGREALHHPTPTTRAGYWVLLRDFKSISIQGWLMMKWCRSFKMKTSKIKGFLGHHERQGCIQSPVHKNKKYEQRLEDLDGSTTFAAT